MKNLSFVSTSYHYSAKPVLTVVSFTQILGIDCNIEECICQKVDIK